MNKFDVFIGEGLDHRPPIQIVSIDIGDVAAFYFRVKNFFPHLFVVRLCVPFGAYES